MGFLPKSPKFFKIIFEPQALRLRIPAEFMRRHGKNMRNPVLLRVPTGSQMEVELIQSDGETWLQKGWEDFRDCFSIGFGHFLVFEYTGNSIFNVLIFDMSASEIEYPFHQNRDEGILVESDSDDSVVFLEEIPTNKKRKEVRGKNNQENDDIPVLKELKKRKGAKADDSNEFSDDSQMRTSSVNTEMKNLQSCSKGSLKSEASSLKNHSKQVPSRRVTFDLDSQSSKKEGSGRQCSNKEQVNGVIDKEKSAAYQRATTFMSVNPSRKPFVVALLQPSYVYILNLPLSFGKENLPGRMNDLTLRVSNGKTWKVRCTLGVSSVKVSSGWKDFVQDNGLKVGDVCIFEVVKNSKLLWNVIIFRS